MNPVGPYDRRGCRHSGTVGVPTGRTPCGIGRPRIADAAYASAKIEDHLAGVAADHRPFQLHLRGTGTFRPVTDVVFVAVAAGIAACEQLAADITSGPLSRPLKYPYHPHVTVAQDVSESALDAIYDGLTSFEARFPVDSFTLYEHGPDGRWQPQRRFVLCGDGVATQP